MNKALHRIVVVGGGASGLELVSMLGRTVGRHRLARPILVDHSPAHVWKPLLHEVATGALNSGEDEVNYLSHAHKNYYEFELGKMLNLNRNNRTIQLDKITVPGAGQDQVQVAVQPRTIPFDTLVLAIGSVSNHFNTPGVNEHCYFLNSPKDAETIRVKILHQALSVSTGSSKVPKLRIGVIGGGATGVELAAEIHHTVCQLRQAGSNLNPNQLEITILEGASTVLSTAPPPLAKYATVQLQKRNINVKTNCWIKQVDKEGFIFADGSRLDTDIKIWTAGIKAPDFIRNFGLTVNKLNQITTNRNLQSVEDESIFAIGDCASVPLIEDPKNPKFLPATAQVAHQQAEYLAESLTQYFQNQQTSYNPKPFVYKPQGMLVSMGESSAAANVATVGQLYYYFEGKSAKVLYASLYFMHQAVLFGWTKAMFLWFGDKLRKLTVPSVKLH